MREHFVVAFEDSFDARYGLEYVTYTHARATFTEPPSTGVLAAVAESLASTGTAVEVLPSGCFPSGLSNATYLVGEPRPGVHEAIARCRARGELEWLWDVEIAPPGGALVAIATVAIAVRKRDV